VQHKHTEWNGNIGLRLEMVGTVMPTFFKCSYIKLKNLEQHTAVKTRFFFRTRCWGKRIFPLASVSRPALGPTQLPVQWVLGVISPGVKRGRGVTLTTHPHPEPRSWMS